MYKVLIVDDEYYVRERLKCCIEWEKYGFVVSAEAEDGEQALEVIETIEPHLVIADIEMPFINGIRLAEILYQRKLDVKLIFLTGFDNFEYAQSAIKYGVQNYLLKPIEEKALIDALQSVHNLLDRQKTISEKIRWGDHAYEKIKDNLLKKLYSKKIEEVSAALVNIIEDAKTYHYSSSELEGVSQILMETASLYYKKVHESSDTPAGLFEVDQLNEMDADKLKEFFINLFVGRLCEFKNEKNSRLDELIEAAKEYIGKSYTDPELSLTTISRNIYLNPSYLSRVFNQLTGQSVPAFIEEIRLTNAMNMLKEGFNSIDTIALQCGYKNTGYFSKCFKEKFGICPSDLIKSSYKKAWKGVIKNDRKGISKAGGRSHQSGAV